MGRESERGVGRVYLTLAEIYDEDKKKWEKIRQGEEEGK